MNLSDAQLRKIFSGIYADACLDEKINMLDFVANFESIREQLVNNGGAGCWNFMKLNKDFFLQQPNLNFLQKLQQVYYDDLNRHIAQHIETLLTTAPQQAWDTWLQEYVAAVINWGSKVYEPLCNTQFDFSDDQQKRIATYKKLNQYILLEKWVNTLPFFEALTKETCLSNYQLSCLNVITGQVILYWMPDMQQSVPYFETAKTLMPDNCKAVRAMGEYYLRNLDYEKARNAFLSALSLQPNDPDNYIYMADTYRDERKLETAEQWYKDAININLLATESLGRLIQLYGQPEWEATKKHQIDELLQQAERIETNQPIENGLYSRYRDAGHAFFAIPEYTTAIKYYEKANNLRPDLVVAKLDIGYTYGYMKDFDNAKNWFNLSLSTMDESLNFDTYWALSWLYEQATTAAPTEENIGKSIEYYEKCGALRSELLDNIKNAIGILYFNTGNYKKALEYYITAIDLNPDISVYTDNYNSALSKMADNTLFDIETNNPTILNATGNFFYGINNFEKAKQFYQRAIDNKQSAVFFKNLAFTDEKLNLPSEAEAAFKKAAELDTATGNSVNQLGVFYYNSGQFEKSIESYRNALAKEPANETYLQNLGYAFESIFKYEEAKDVYNQILASNAANANAWHRLAVIASNTQNYNEGLTAISKALELQPNDITYLKSAAGFYENLKNDEEALKIYLKALAINDGDEYFNNRAGIIYYRRGTTDSLIQAKEYYKKAIEASEKSAPEKTPTINEYKSVYLQNLALAHADLGENADAEKAYLQSIELDPKNAENYNMTGVFYFKIADWTNALNMFTQAMQLNPKNAIYYKNLANTYEKTSDHENATSMNLKAAEIENGN